MSYRLSLNVPRSVYRMLLFACVMPAALPAFAAADSELIRIGSEIAQKGASGQAPCMACHGVKGEGLATAGYPYLAAQPAEYLQQQLTHFADGSRKQPIMQPIAKSLDEKQREAVSAYYASLQPVFDRDAVSQRVQTYPKDQPGAWMANRGNENPYIPACIQCHGPGGIGVDPVFPALAGQSENYLQTQLTAMKSGDRKGDSHELMVHLAENLSDEQIREVSQYFAKDVLQPVASQLTPEKGVSK